MNTEDFKRLKAHIHAHRLDLLGDEIALRPGAASEHSPLDHWTLLHVAAEAGYGDAVDLLVARGAVVNAGNAEHRRPLHFAMLAQREDAIIRLLELGADAQMNDYNNLNPLQFAIQRPVPPVHEAQRLLNISTLLSLCENADRPDYANDDALHAAAKTGFIGALDLLLDGKHDIEQRNSTGGTLLHSAVLGRKPAMIDHLLQKGADINSRDLRDATPLHYAIQIAGPGRAEFAAFLLSRGAQPEARDRNNARAEDLTTDEDILQVFAAFRAQRGVLAAIAGRMSAKAPAPD